MDLQQRLPQRRLAQCVQRRGVAQQRQHSEGMLIGVAQWQNPGTVPRHEALAQPLEGATHADHACDVLDRAGMTADQSIDQRIVQLAHIQLRQSRRFFRHAGKRSQAVTRLIQAIAHPQTQRAAIHGCSQDHCRQPVGMRRPGHVARDARDLDRIQLPRHRHSTTASKALPLHDRSARRKAVPSANRCRTDKDSGGNNSPSMLASSMRAPF